MNDSRTSVSQLERVQNSMTKMFNEVTKEKMTAFPAEKNNPTTALEPRLEMIGNFGDSTHPKKQKRSRY